MCSDANYKYSEGWNRNSFLKPWSQSPRFFSSLQSFAFLVTWGEFFPKEWPQISKRIVELLHQSTEAGSVLCILSKDRREMKFPLESLHVGIPIVPTVKRSSSVGVLIFSSEMQWRSWRVSLACRRPGPASPSRLGLTSLYAQFYNVLSVTEPVRTNVLWSLQELALLWRDISNGCLDYL